MQNPIPTSNMWHTPADLNELYAMVEQFSGEQRSLAAHVMMLTLNTCSKLVDEAAKETV